MDSATNKIMSCSAHLPLLYETLREKTWLVLIGFLLAGQLIAILLLGIECEESQLLDYTSVTNISPCRPKSSLGAVGKSDNKNKTGKEKVVSSSLPQALNPTFWPPIENSTYPDFELYNQDGEKTRLSNLKGSIIIVQPIAMNCSASQSYCGANRKDIKALGLCFPNPKVREFPRIMKDFTGIDMKHSGIVLVQIIFYNMENKRPTREDARLWARHFGLRTVNNQYVLVANDRMINDRSKLLIPGFQLIDRTFNLRSDSTGPLPKRNLYNHFFSKLRMLLPTS